MQRKSKESIKMARSRSRMGIHCHSRSSTYSSDDAESTDSNDPNYEIDSNNSNRSRNFQAHQRFEAKYANIIS